MKELANEQVFAAPKLTREAKAKARFERAKLVIIAARERAVEMAQQHPVRTSTIRLSVRQKRRLAERLSAMGR